uniref:Globin domain-containing protein n=1 Tax=Eptatretus burgeri TaxID=7764 RepID=A0A8C4PXE8_EPTBU
MPIVDQGPLPTLSDGDKKAIRETWREIYDQFEANSLKVLLSFLKDFPGAQQLFPKFSEVKSADLPHNPEVKWQASRIINAINDAIRLMDKEREMIQFLKELSRKHSAEFQVDSRLFKEMVKIFAHQAFIPVGSKEAYEKLFSGGGGGGVCPSMFSRHIFPCMPCSPHHVDIPSQTIQMNHPV